jgi:hypothetical protein
MNERFPANRLKASRGNERKEPYREPELRDILPVSYGIVVHGQDASMFPPADKEDLEGDL